MGNWSWWCRGLFFNNAHNGTPSPPQHKAIKWDERLESHQLCGTMCLQDLGMLSGGAQQQTWSMAAWCWKRGVNKAGHDPLGATHECRVSCHSLRVSFDPNCVWIRWPKPESDHTPSSPAWNLTLNQNEKSCP